MAYVTIMVLLSLLQPCQHTVIMTEKVSIICSFLVSTYVQDNDFRFHVNLVRLILYEKIFSSTFLMALVRLIYQEFY